MKYQNQITVNVSLSRFIELMDDPDNMQYWQQGFQSYEFLSDKKGEVGSQMKLNYLMGKRPMELIETITVYDMPNQFAATYETKGLWNLVDNHFSQKEQDQTLWVSDCEFKFTGMMRIMSWFMPKSMFKKQSCQMLEDFKKFAESTDK